MGQRSDCCNAKVKIVGETDPHYVCRRCKQVCHVIMKVRQEWGLDPSTKIIPAKKRNKRTRLTPKEEREIMRDLLY
jgi:hypothetical protein